MELAMRGRILGIALGTAFAIGVGLPAAAQDEATPVTLGAESCTVEPIDPVAYNAAIDASIPPLAANPYPVGELADAETVAAVTEVIEQSVACTNIGDLGRLLALLDPAYAPTLLGVPYAEVPAAIEAAAAVSTSPDPATPLVDDIDQEGLVSRILDISNVQVLEDGRVSAEATVERLDMPATTFTIHLRYDEVEGRYIITNYAYHYPTPAA
jgi:hypothetical protein